MSKYYWIILSFVSLFSLTANYIIDRAFSINYSPFLVISITGAVQFIISGVLFLLSDEKLSHLTSTDAILAALVAFCVLGIDYGMITAYKYGGNSVFITLIVSMTPVVMVPISLIFFKEHMTLPQTVGVLLSVISLALIILFPAK